MNSLQQAINQTNKQISTANDPFEITALQIGNIANQSGLLAGKGISWGADELQQAIQALANPSSQKKASAQVISPVAKTTPTPTPQTWYTENQAYNGNPPAQPTQPIKQPTTQTPIQQAVQTLTPTPYPPSELPKGATPFEAAASPLFEQAKIPAAIGMGIWAMEGRGKTVNPNNPYNIGAYDTNPQNANAYGFKTPIDGAAAAVAFLKGDSPYLAPDKAAIFKKAYQQLQKNNDAEAYLKAIGPTYSSNKNWASTIMQTPEYQRWAGGN